MTGLEGLRKISRPGEPAAEARLEKVADVARCARVAAARKTARARREARTRRFCAVLVVNLAFFVVA